MNDPDKKTADGPFAKEPPASMLPRIAIQASMVASRRPIRQPVKVTPTPSAVSAALNFFAPGQIKGER